MIKKRKKQVYATKEVRYKTTETELYSVCDLCEMNEVDWCKCYECGSDDSILVIRDVEYVFCESCLKSKMEPWLESQKKTNE